MNEINGQNTAITDVPVGMDALQAAQTAEDELLMERFDLWLKKTTEPFDEWKFDGENFIVYAEGKEPEIYESALVRELVGLN